MSRSPVISSVGVVTLPTYMSGEYLSHAVGSSQNGLSNHCLVKSGISVSPRKESQSITGQRTAAAAKRVVCPIVQLDSTPPPLQPPTYIRVVSTHPRPITSLTPSIRSS